MASERASLLIADISGYTGYLAGVELDHAQDILADLMGAIVGALRPGFRLAKLEGDAAFMFTIGEELDGSLLLDAIERCYFGFRRRRRDVRQATSCDCNACVRIPDLNLKFVAHHGTILRQRVAGARSCSGPTSSWSTGS
jgi:class 3 adenylate cyclase